MNDTIPIYEKSIVRFDTASSDTLPIAIDTKPIAIEKTGLTIGFDV